MTSQPTLHSATSDSSISSTCAAYNLTATQFSLLQTAATSAKSLAYCPYSRFRVGAALLAPDGETVIKGANVENASYPVGTCAERVAIGNAVTREVPVKTFKAIAVATDISPPASPCGMCRQFIREFCSLEMPIIMFDSKDQYVVMKLGELLPMSFGPDALPPPGAPGAQG
ncbi:cytidine and deoxycytidylate deaminase zinc-binding region domain-containing protein [Sarocladium implicatum]|nr:cytidine and deoxycytidylate deaminase zinc-binding region domain-containing protein [Sarocladium implicatum]